jgi:hypothetical protein
MIFVSITRLRVRSWRFLPSFAGYTFRSMRQARAAAGNLAIRLLAERRNTFWTATAWTSDVAMCEFMLAGAHRQAMSKLAHWCDEAAVVHWNQEDARLPAWREAWIRLQREGRKSQVLYPSPAHLAQQFAPPRSKD